VTITEKHRQTLINALQLAQHQYTLDAEQMRLAGAQRIADQFDQQAHDANQLLNAFELDEVVISQ
jgi:hypothetical protein